MCIASKQRIQPRTGDPDSRGHTQRNSETSAYHIYSEKFVDVSVPHLVVVDGVDALGDVDC